MKSLTNQSDNPDYNINFLIGINWIFKSDYKQAIHFFLVAIVETDPSDEHYSIYQSYAGLSSVLLRQLGGMHHCYHSSKLTLPVKPEVWLNLACAEFLSGNRERAMKALDHIDASELSASMAKEIDCFFEMVGIREKDAISFLNRDNILNKFMGQPLRKKPVEVEHIEAFIRETAIKRYKDAMLKIHRKRLKNLPDTVAKNSASMPDSKAE